MKKRLLYLVYAVLFNAIGTALMAESNLGMSAWGVAAINVSNFFQISLGTAFNALAVVFYTFALILRKKISVKEMIFSFGFAFSYGFFTDFFIWIIPSITEYGFLFRLLVNVIGLLIMCMGIAIHLRIYLAVHPMDVYLDAVQKGVKSVSLGTYIAYGSAFLVGLIFGILGHNLIGVGVGTAATLLLGGAILGYYDKRLRI